MLWTEGLCFLPNSDIETYSPSCGYLEAGPLEGDGQGRKGEALVMELSPMKETPEGALVFLAL